MMNTAGPLALSLAADFGGKVSVDLSLTGRIEAAVGDLLSLREYLTQWGDQVVGRPDYFVVARSVVASLRAIPEIYSGNFDDIEGWLLGADAAEAASVLIKKALPPLLIKMEEFVPGVESAFHKELLALNHVVNGGRPVAGLPDLSSIPSVFSSVPQWARKFFYHVIHREEVELDQNGCWSLYGRYGGRAEISFRYGRYWVSYSSPKSIWSYDYWADRFCEEVLVYRDCQSFRLRPGVHCPVTSNDTVLFRGESGMSLSFPRPPTLETLKGEILATRNLGELAALLRNRGITDIPEQIGRHLKTGATFQNIPHEGGLSLKIQELVLRHEFDRIHKTYLSYLPEDQARQMLASLAVAIRDASSPQELWNVALKNIVPGTVPLFHGAWKAFSGSPGASLDGVSEVCGLRARVHEFLSRRYKNRSRSG